MHTKMHQPRSSITNLHQTPQIIVRYLTMLFFIFTFKLLNITPSDAMIISEKSNF